MKILTLEKLLGVMSADEMRGMAGCSWCPSGPLPDDLYLPAKLEEPHHVLVDCDLFHESVPGELVDSVFDVMWLCSQHTFWVLSQNVERMVDYTRYQRGSFGWTDLDRLPLRPGDHIHLDDMYYRDQCGYRHDGKDEHGERLDWACEHPQNDERLENCSCHRHSCPIAGCADSRYQLEAIDVIGDYDKFFRGDGGSLVGANDKPKPDDHVEETEWMELYGRPRNAMCGNVWLGFSAPDQQSFEKSMRLFRILRENPHRMLFCHIGESVNTTILYHGQGESDDFQWSPLEKCRFSHGGKEVFRPYLDRIIAGKEGAA